jgi:hypothetical protein
LPNLRIALRFHFNAFNTGAIGICRNTPLLLGAFGYLVRPYYWKIPLRKVPADVESGLCIAAISGGKIGRNVVGPPIRVIANARCENNNY